MNSITHTAPKLPAGSNRCKSLTSELAARKHFNALSRDEKVQAIFRMADIGYSDYSIATATKLNVEMVRQILAKRE